MATKEELMDASTPLLNDVDVPHVVQVSLCNAHFKVMTFFFYKVVAHETILFLVSQG